MVFSSSETLPLFLSSLFLWVLVFLLGFISSPNTRRNPITTSRSLLYMLCSMYSKVIE